MGTDGMANKGCGNQPVYSAPLSKWPPGAVAAILEAQAGRWHQQFSMYNEVCGGSSDAADSHAYLYPYTGLTPGRHPHPHPLISPRPPRPRQAIVESWYYNAHLPGIVEAVWYEGRCGEDCAAAASRVRSNFIAHFGLAADAVPLLRFDGGFWP